MRAGGQSGSRLSSLQFFTNLKNTTKEKTAMEKKVRAGISFLGPTTRSGELLLTVSVSNALEVAAGSQVVTDPIRMRTWASPSPRSFQAKTGASRHFPKKKKSPHSEAQNLRSVRCLTVILYHLRWMNGGEKYLSLIHI